ncbi:MAG: N-6 DNA methylase [Tepidisphaeraceae bacterium]
MSPITISLPPDTGTGDLDDFAARRRVLLLNELDRSRHTVYHCLRRASSTSDTVIAQRATDQLLGLVLLLRFVRQNQVDAVPSIEHLFNTNHDRTIRQIVRDVQRQIISPVLHAVFNPDDWDDAMPLPDGLHRYVSVYRVPKGRLTLASFGDLHQLCVAAPSVDKRIALHRAGGIRRSRGIHYTPPCIVDYLTRRVFDQLAIPELGSTDEQLQVLDPSCGCGAFLAAAAKQLFQTLAERHGRDFSLQCRLDLLWSIRGIDIDSQAAVWARRVLLLSVWEEALGMNIDIASSESVRVPELRNTIITGDFLSMQIPPVDALLGGPPFVRLQQLRLADSRLLAQYKSTFRTARSGQFDLYMLFFEKALDVLRAGGRLGWSVSNTFVRSQSGRTVRQLISNKCAVRELVEFEDRKLYPDAVTQIALILLEKADAPVSCRHVWIRGKGALHTKLPMLLKNDRISDPSITVADLAPTAYRGGDWSLNSPERSSVLAGIKRIGTPLGMLPIRICSGIVTGADDVFLVREIRARGDGMTLVRNRAGSEYLIESALLRPIVRNREIHAFAQPTPRALCVVPYDEAGKSLDETRLRERFPGAHRYLQFHQRQLVARRCVHGVPWFAFRSSAALELPAGPRILLKRISSRPDYAIDRAGSKLCHGTVLLLAPTSPFIDPLALLGILNSSTFWTFVQSEMPTMGDGYAVRSTPLRRFSLPFSPHHAAQTDLKAINEIVTALLAQGLASSRRAALKQGLNSAVALVYSDTPSGFPNNQT